MGMLVVVKFGEIIKLLFIKISYLTASRFGGFSLVR